MCINSTQGSKGDGARLFSAVPSDRTRGSGPKWKYGKRNIRKHVFTARVVERRYRLPTEAEESPSLEMFKTCLDMALGSQLQLTPL